MQGTETQSNLRVMLSLMRLADAAEMGKIRHNFKNWCDKNPTASAEATAAKLYEITYVATA